MTFGMREGSGMFGRTAPSDRSCRRRRPPVACWPAAIEPLEPRYLLSAAAGLGGEAEFVACPPVDPSLAGDPAESVPIDSPVVLAAPFPLIETFQLHSAPSASKTIL